MKLGDDIFEFIDDEDNDGPDIFNEFDEYLGNPKEDFSQVQSKCDVDVSIEDGYSDINAPIEYELPWSWSSRISKPIVNQLLRAIIECDVAQMNYLFDHGALLNMVDRSTFGLVLFHIIREYPVFKVLTENGFCGSVGYNFNQFDVVNLSGYCSGLPAHAWNAGAYDVYELLIQNGFGNLKYHSDKVYSAGDMMFYRNDIRSVVVYLENGGFINEFERSIRMYPNSKVTYYLVEHPFIKRKSLALDPCLFEDIPKPDFEKEGIFNRADVRERNRIKLADYEDRVALQKEFINKYGYDRWHKKKAEFDHLRNDPRVIQAMIEIANKL